MTCLNQVIISDEERYLGRVETSEDREQMELQRQWLKSDLVARLRKVLGDDWPIDGRPGNPTYRQVSERVYPNWTNFFKVRGCC